MLNLKGLALSFSCVIHALHITKLSVPKKADFGSTVSLRCDFDLGSEKLHSLKWYKDEIEFYRFIPKQNLHIQVFPQIGIIIDEEHSGLNVVVLKNLTFESNGKYLCEVSIGGPSFKTDEMSDNLTVYAYSPEDPIISGLAESYPPGAYMHANCSAGPSNPQPEIKWFINEEEAANNHLITYPTTELPDATFFKIVGLRLIAMTNDFKPPRNTITLQCKVSVGEMEPWNAYKIIHIKLQPYQINHREIIVKEESSSHSPETEIVGCLYFLSIACISTNKLIIP